MCLQILLMRAVVPVCVCVCICARARLAGLISSVHIILHMHAACPAFYFHLLSVHTHTHTHTGTTVRSPINRLTAEQKEEVLQLVVRLNGGSGSMQVYDNVSKELSELDMGDWQGSMAEAAAFLKKRDYTADPTQVHILVASKPDYMRNFWLVKAAPQFPLLAVAANKLLSAHCTTAAAERNWSAWGRTYTNLRNRLSIETAEKLVYVKANMPEQWYTEQL